ncbi:MAG: hypothetical protein R3D57_02380 [Hyphomicrobiaceae bacterium]
MRLNFEGKTTDNPTSADIVRAIPRGRVPEEWTIEMVNLDGTSIEADPGPEQGQFRVTYVEGRRIYDADRPLTADELERLLMAFRDQDDGWRRQASWTIWAPSPKDAKSQRAWLPVMILLTVLLAALGIALRFLGML